MSLDDFIITCFCLIDEILPSATAGQRLVRRLEKLGYQVSVSAA